jgi:hypothetical protein
MHYSNDTWKRLSWFGLTALMQIERMMKRKEKLQLPLSGNSTRGSITSVRGCDMQ